MWPVQFRKRRNWFRTITLQFSKGTTPTRYRGGIAETRRRRFSCNLRGEGGFNPRNNRRDNDYVEEI